jgi:hypothetical protein
MTPDRLPTLTNDEWLLLRSVAVNGPVKFLPRPTSGRFELYGLIAETPNGWIITRAGRAALGRKPAEEDASPQDPHPTERSAKTGKRLPNRRKSPFH